MKLFTLILILLLSISSWASIDLDRKLLECSESGDLSCVKEALQKGANILARNPRTQDTPLHISAYEGHLDIVQFLISVNSTREYLMAKDGSQNIPLHAATTGRNTQVVQVLLKRYTHEQITAVNQWNRTALHWAARTGNLPIVQLFLEKHNKIQDVLMAQYKKEDSPLHLALEKDHFEIAKLLITQLHTPELLMTQGDDDMTPLHLAASGAPFEIFKLLIDKYSTPQYLMMRNEYKNTALHIAARRGHLPMVQLLINKYNTPKHFMAKGSFNKTPLHMTTDRDQLKVFQFLINKYNTPRQIFNKNKNEWNESILHTAAERGSVKIIKWFMDNYDATPFLMAQNKHKRSPLHLAADEKHIEAIKLLIEELPTAQHLLLKDTNGLSAFDDALDISMVNNDFSIPFIIFGNSPPKIRAEFVKSCNKVRNSFRQKFCHQLSHFVNEENTAEEGGYL